MRILLYIVIIGLLFAAPLERLDIAKLEPVQTVAVRVTEEQIELETDTGNIGQGTTVEEAVSDLKKRTPGVIYLDTAEYLLLTEDAAAHAQELRKYLRPPVLVCIWDGTGSVAGAAKYLNVRDDLPRLCDWKPFAEKS